MPSGRSARAKPSAPPPSASPLPAEAPWGEIDQAFREFRESAVRLVERVNDLLAPHAPRGSPAPKDIRLVRAVFGKWSTEVLVALHSAPSVGFEELRRSLPGISPRVLSLKLKGLEQHGMVRREILDSRPPRVRYTLTERGWTVAWLSDPVLLFLEQSEAREAAPPVGAAPSPAQSPR
ncbi:MAG: helix-turn-helix transcriptional regulator [Thermoplasmata archaeon]|jgi:DNA-binding HxlR family transcriptional regulator|nr:helix-turn-helix transcriptional regulator [Thermoplasmata archaeon]